MEENRLISDDFSPELKKQIVEFLSSYVTPNKQHLIEQVLSKRTRHLTVVMEDIFKPHNASAVIRTAECLGIQDVHIVEKSNQYAPNPWVLRGALKWMTVRHYPSSNPNSIADCFRHLKGQGYQIVATDVDQRSVPLSEVDVGEKTALVMGTEHEGISDYVRENADQLVTIPMSGFTESFNVSVSAAICLNHLLTEMRNKGIHWQLTEAEMAELRYRWYSRIPAHAENLISHYMKENGLK